jgi:hypothetical protein
VIVEIDIDEITKKYNCRHREVIDSYYSFVVACDAIGIKLHTKSSNQDDNKNRHIDDREYKGGDSAKNLDGYYGY